MPRASWRGFLRLSLVSCPIYLSPATSRTKPIRLHQVWRPASMEEPEDGFSDQVREKQLDERPGETPGAPPPLCDPYRSRITGRSNDFCARLKSTAIPVSIRLAPLFLAKAPVSAGACADRRGATRAKRVFTRC